MAKFAPCKILPFELSFRRERSRTVRRGPALPDEPNLTSKAGPRRGNDQTDSELPRYLMGDGFAVWRHHAASTAPVKRPVTTQNELARRPPQSRLGHPPKQ